MIEPGHGIHGSEESIVVKNSNMDFLNSHSLHPPQQSIHCVYVSFCPPTKHVYVCMCVSLIAFRGQDVDAVLQQPAASGAPCHLLSERAT